MRGQKIVIDVTDFVYWTGHFTGIQRSVYNITLAMIRRGEHIKLTVFVDGEYRLLNQSLESLVKNGLLRKHIHQPSREEIFRGNIKAAFTRLPPLYKRGAAPLLPLFGYGAKTSIPVARKVLHKFRSYKSSGTRRDTTIYRWAPDEVIVGRPIMFNKHDTLLMFGCLWRDAEHLNAFINTKTLHDITLGVLIYDLIPIYHPHTFGEGLLPIFSQYLFEVMSTADILFPISESSSRDASRFMTETGITHKLKTKVIRLGDSIPNKVSVTLYKKLEECFVAPFMICVGTIEARKNHVLIYKALKLAAAQNLLGWLPHLYIIGRSGWLAHDVEYFLRNDTTISKKVTILNDVSDAELSWFYDNALLSVYPSQYEGWGLPVAESLVYGLPCITSDTSSMVEIAPSLVSLVSPYDPAALLKAIYELIDPVKNQLARTRIKTDYKPTKWEDTALKIVRELNKHESK